MDKLYEVLSINVYSGRWRCDLQKAVDENQGNKCLQLLQIIELLPK